MRVHHLIVLAWLASAARAGAQSLAERIRTEGTRTVAFSARARPEVCGDGATYVSDGLGGRSTMYIDLSDGRGWQPAPCTHGSVRVSVRVVDGLPARLRVTAGSLPVLGDSVLDLGDVGTAQASAYLRELARTSDGRVAEQALYPLVLVDSVPRWEILAAAARDSTRLLRYRRRASDLLARGAVGTLGSAAYADDDAAGERRAAIGALANRRDRDEDLIPQLLDIARTNRHADVRAEAIRRLGQTADARAVGLMAGMLGVR